LNLGSPQLREVNPMPQELQPFARPVSQACKLAGVGETKFREAIKNGEIEVCKVGDLTLVEDEAIKRWLASKRVRLGVPQANGGDEK
jgi:excisionase family DNA binding protein